MDHGVQTKRLRKKLGRARGIIHQVRSIFTGERWFSLGPPLREEEVAAFERAQGISLPSCYRAFVTQVGHGGGVTASSIVPAPFGLLPLGEDLLTGSGRTLRRVGHPPLIAPGMTDEAWDEILREHTRLASEQGDDDEAADVWLYGGLLDLASAGCAGVWCLLVSGPWRGHVVHANMDDLKPVFEPEANFLDWYERELDAVLGGDASAAR